MTARRKISHTVVIGLIAAAALTTTAFADTTHTFQATLSGNSDVPAVNSQTTGSIMLTFNNADAMSGSMMNGNMTNGSAMHYTLNAVGNDITMAHLHCAAAGANGPAIVTLYMMNPQNQATSTGSASSSMTMTGVTINGVLSSGSISNADIKSADCMSKIGSNIYTVSDLANAITNGKIYANIHTVQFPDGAARGQLMENMTSGTANAPVIASASMTKEQQLISLYQQLITVLTQMLQLLQQNRKG